MITPAPEYAQQILDHSKILDDINIFLAPWRAKYNPLIVVPDIGKIYYRNPFKHIIHKIFEENHDFHIVTPEELGRDVVWDFQMTTALKKNKFSSFILNDKLVCLDYDDNSGIERSYARRCINHLKTEQIAGIIKFQYANQHYAHFPVPVYPFFYPGMNDYRQLSAGYPLMDIHKLRSSFKDCCDTNSFQANIFARWADFPERRSYTKLCSNISNIDVSMEDIPFEEYLKKMCTSKFAIAIRGGGKFSHREMESAAIGVPLLYEDRGQRMLEPFLPNVHYIPVTSETFVDQCKHYLDHYDEALQIGQNARNYYDENLSQEGMQKGFKKIIEMILRKERWIEY